MIYRRREGIERIILMEAMRGKRESGGRKREREREREGGKGREVSYLPFVSSGS